MSIFPLKLTPLEEFMFLDDYPAYPNLCVARMIFDGEVNEGSLLKAIDHVLQRQPMLRCHIQKSGRKYFWIEHDQTASGIVSRLDLKDVYEIPRLEQIDLTSSTAGRIHYFTGGGKTLFLMPTHHAAMDGVGGIQLVDEILKCYDAAEKGDVTQAKIRKLDFERIKERGNLGSRGFDLTKQLPKLSLSIIGIREFFRRAATPFIPGEIPDPSQSTESPTIGVHRLTLGKDLSKRFREIAHESEVTTNELIIRDVGFSLRQFREKCDLGNQNDILRLMIPVNIRTLADRRLASVNRVSFITFDRVQNKFDRSEGFLAGIRSQMSVIFNYRLEHAFLALLYMTKFLPKGLRRLAKADRCGATCLLTNLGTPFGGNGLSNKVDKLVSGNLTLIEYDLIPPLRPLTQVAIAVARYQNNLQFSLNYDRRKIQKSQIEMFARILERQIVRTIEQTAETAE